MEAKAREELYPLANEVRTPDQLRDFVVKAMSRNHDYGSVCIAVAACAVAAAKCADRQPNGGITGFQAGAVMWEFMKEWNDIKAPARIQQFDDMLFPQMAHKFEKVIAPETWAHLQTEAKSKLENIDPAQVHPDVIDHWKSIELGVVPFGYKVKEN